MTHPSMPTHLQPTASTRPQARTATPTRAAYAASSTSHHKPRSHHDRRTKFILLALLVATLTIAPNTSAGTITYEDRESTYPPGVANITHDPWDPIWGKDIHVTVTLNASEEIPSEVSLLYCRVEPSYACGFPDIMSSNGNGTVWKGRIVWDDRFMQDGMQHIGYNVSLFYDDRVRFAPMGNYELPETYPAEADGIYYFLSVDPSTAESPPMSIIAFLLVALLGFLWQRSERRAPPRRTDP